MKQQLYGHLPPISEIIQARHVGYSKRSNDKLIWTPTHGRASISWPTRNYLHQLCADTGCNLEDLLWATDDRDRWRERVRKIRVVCVTWRWWWWCQHQQFLMNIILKWFYFLGNLDFITSSTYWLIFGSAFFISKKYVGLQGIQKVHKKCMKFLK